MLKECSPMSLVGFLQQVFSPIVRAMLLIILRIAECKCREQDLLPSEWRQEYTRRNSTKTQRGNSIAVLMGGQTRSLASRLMREYWRLFLVLFAVLSRNSTNRKRKTEASIFTAEQLQRILAGIKVTWRAAFPLDCTWEEAALLVKDPALRFLLSPPEHLIHVANFGLFNAYRSRAVAFDLMLQFETQNHQRFTHVLFARPDIVYDLNPNIVSAIERCPDAVFCYNDQFGAMKRSLALWYATHVATARSWTGASLIAVNQSQTSQGIQQLLGWKFTGSGRGGVFMPAMHLAIHGVPFVGKRLEVISHSHEVACNHSDLFRNRWFIRDLKPRVSAEVCLEQRAGSNLTDAFQALGRLGMNPLLRNSLSACQN